LVSQLDLRSPSPHLDRPARRRLHDVSPRSCISRRASTAKLEVSSFRRSLSPISLGAFAIWRGGRASKSRSARVILYRFGHGASCRDR